MSAGLMAEFLKERDDFVLLSHTAPDGDTIGSMLALYFALTAMGKRVECVCNQKVPYIYSFLPGADTVLLPDEAQPAATAVAIDCADIKRMSAGQALFEGAEKTAQIDHHVTNEAYADLNYIGRETAAAGELVFEVIRLLPVELTKDMATCLYTAIMTDTGNFAYANTRPHTLITAASLLEAGANNNEINRLVYKTVPLHKQKLLGLAITKAEFSDDMKIGLTSITLEDMASCGAGEEDTEGIIEHIRDVEGDEIAIMMRESAKNKYKVSLRSKVYADVGAVAARMGGGGHRQAAGYSTEGDYESVRQNVIQMAMEALSV